MSKMTKKEIEETFEKLKNLVAELPKDRQAVLKESLSEIDGLDLFSEKIELTRFYSVTEFCELLQVSRKTFEKMAREGLKRTKIGSIYKVAGKDIINHLRAGQTTIKREDEPEPDIEE